MDPYLRRRRRQKGKALGAAISRQIERLRALAQDLNESGTPSLPTSLKGAVFHRVAKPLGRDATANAEDGKRRASAIIEATSGTPYPKVPAAAANLFNALADRTPLHYVAGLWRPEDTGQYFITLSRSEHEATYEALRGLGIMLRSRSLSGIWTELLAEFLISPYRDRLRRCPVCARWFVDETRNRSARRCSRKCTIAWSNAQRGHKREEATDR